MMNILNDMREKGVIIYGGGRIGKQILKELQSENIPIISVWDQNASNINNVEKVESPNLSYKNKDIYVIICIYSNKICANVEKSLKQNGFEKVYYYNSKVLDEIRCDIKVMDPRKCNRCVLNNGGCEQYISSLRKEKKAHLEIKELHISTNSACTLNCKNCVMMMPEYKKQKLCYEMDFAVFSDVWNKVERVFGWVNMLYLAGGEFFLHRAWRNILKICLSSDWIGVISITTNGVYKLSEEDLCLLANPKLIILLDDYTSKLNAQQKELFEETMHQFEAYHVNYMRLDNTGGTWYNLGVFEENHLSKEALKKVFAGCFFNECPGILYNYKFIGCGRVGAAKDLGYVDTTECDTVDLLHCDDIEEIREKIRKLRDKDYLEICKYCNGSRYIVPAGEQAEEK